MFYHLSFSSLWTLWALQSTAYSKRSDHVLVQFVSIQYSITTVWYCCVVG